MLKLPLASLVVGLIVSHASAQSLKPVENGPEDLGSAQSFKCEPVGPTNNRIVAADRPDTVMVSITFNEGRKVPFDLKVVHVEESGEKYNQADQYMRLHLVAIPNHQDYNWYGTGAKDHSLLIHGQLLQKDSLRFGANRWFYNEELFERGLKISEFQGVCDKTS
ncbi:MAG: hypothetical protein WA733_20395 [Methylocystis sp.]